MTRDELLTRMKLRRFHRERATFAQLVQIVQAMSSAQKASLMQFLNAGDAAGAGSLLVSPISQLRRAQAEAFVDAAAADDAWTTAELLELLE